jgi:hypothetical protein
MVAIFGVSDLGCDIYLTLLSFSIVFCGVLEFFIHLKICFWYLWNNLMFFNWQRIASVH